MEKTPNVWVQKRVPTATVQPAIQRYFLGDIVTSEALGFGIVVEVKGNTEIYAKNIRYAHTVVVKFKKYSKLFTYTPEGTATFNIEAGLSLHKGHRHVVPNRRGLYTSGEGVNLFLGKTKNLVVEFKHDETDNCLLFSYLCVKSFEYKTIKLDGEYEVVNEDLFKLCLNELGLEVEHFDTTYAFNPYYVGCNNIKHSLDEPDFSYFTYDPN